MTIRPLKPDDRTDWELLFRAYADFYGTQISHIAEKQVFDWIFDENNDFWCDIAMDESNLAIGFVQYQLMHRSLSGSMVCYLSDLYVEPSVRGTGAGRLMIDHVIEFATQRGIPNVRWLTQEFNYKGRCLYDSYTKKSDFILYSLNVP
ncbi:MAG: GNAT family N-acetyltransferase [Granulosicoccus sp.]